MNAKILIVDDEQAVRKLLSTILSAAGYECQSAESVTMAKIKLASDSFDLLLTDLKMPEESGLDLLRFAKEHYPQTARIMITAFGSPELASQVLAIGVYGFIIKPVTKNEVLIAVENAIQHHRLYQHMLAYRQELEKRVVQRTEKLTVIMDNINVGVALFDTSLRILEINKKMQKWFPDMSISKKLFCYDCLAEKPAEGPCDACPMVNTFQSGKRCETTRSITTESGIQDFRVISSPVINQEGELYAGIAVFEDVTEKIQLEKKLAQAQKFEAVGQLAAGIAHEINSPVQYIGNNIDFLENSFGDLMEIVKTCTKVFSELMAGREISTESIRKLSEQIETADIAYLIDEIPETFHQTAEGFKKIKKIVQAMKEFSHPGTEEKISVDINKILETTITVCRNEWKYVANLELDLAADLPLVSCYADDIGQVFLNIIVNAAHAIESLTENGSKGKGKISIWTGRSENGIQIRIRDSGGGIPEAIQKRVYDPFFTTKKLGKGTGQGLAIASRIVDKHEGKMWFETTTGLGTTFIIELPGL